MRPQAFFTLLFFILLFSCLSGRCSNRDKKDDETRQLVDNQISTARRFLHSEDSIRYSLELLNLANASSQKCNYIAGKIASSYELGRMYMLLSDNPNATKHFYTCLKESRIIGDSVSQSHAFLGLGLVMYNLNKWPEAIENFQNSMTLDPLKTNYAGGSTQEYLLGLCYYRQKQFEKSNKLLEKVRLYAAKEQKGMRHLEAILYQTNIKSELSPRPELLIIYDSLLTVFDARNEKMGKCFALEGKARALYQLGQLEESARVARQSLTLAKKIDIIYPRYAILDILIKAEHKRKNFEAASNFMMELRELEDRTINEKSTTEVVMQMADFEFEKKEESFAKELNFNRKQRIVLILVALLLFGLAAFIFVSRKGIAEERKRSDDLLHNILPAATAKELKQNGFAAAKAHPNATIVFADVKSFTHIAKDLEPQVLVQMLDAYFSKFDYLVKSEGLEKIKTIGDAYMFVAGLEGHDYVHSARKAVSVSLKMLQAMKDCEYEMQETYGIDFKFRFGVHTGDVVSGVVGSIKYAFDVWGDAVNVAARMEESGVPEQINISEVTYGIISDGFICTPRGKIAIKNRGEMAMYFVKSKKKGLSNK